MAFGKTSITSWITYDGTEEFPLNERLLQVENGKKAKLKILKDEGVKLEYDGNGGINVLCGDGHRYSHIQVEGNSRWHEELKSDLWRLADRIDPCSN
jgi:hypothetical protein